MTICSKTKQKSTRNIPIIRKKNFFYSTQFHHFQTILFLFSSRFRRQYRTQTKKKINKQKNNYAKKKKIHTQQTTNWNKKSIADALNIKDGDMQMFIISRKGGVHLVYDNFVYRSNLKRQGRDLNKIYWECIYNRSTKCRGRIKSIGDQLFVTNGTCSINLMLFCSYNEISECDIISTHLFLLLDKASSSIKHH